MQHLVDELVEANKTLAEYKAKYEAFVIPLQAKISELRLKVADELKKSGQFSARFDSATVTRTVRKYMKVTDEQALIAELKARNLTPYFSEQLNELWDGASKELLKAGTILTGTAIEEKESLSLKPNDKPKNVTVQ